MKRRAHVLKPTSSNDRPGAVIFFDTETSQHEMKGGDIEHILKLGVAQHYRKTGKEHLRLQSEKIFHKPTEFWTYINNTIRPKSTVYLVAHNIVFDLSVVNGFTAPAKQGWKLESLYSKGMVSIFRWRDGTRRIIAMDNSNLFAGKLSKWGDIFNVPKLRVDFEHVMDDDLLTYCRRDVEIMVRSWREWLNFLDRHDLGSFKPTVGSTAFNAWRRRFLPSTVHIHDNDLGIKLEREAFKGGRVECLYQGRLMDDTYYYMDVNNMYGYVLANHEYPCGIWDAKNTNSLSMLIKKLNKHAVIARVDVDIDEPLLPYTLNKHTCYPTGSFTTTLTTPELILCFERGWLRGVHAISWYRQAPLFAEFVNEFTDLRHTYQSEGNEGYTAICKLLVNSLYGKTGQLAINQCVIGRTGINDVWSQSVLDARSGEIYRMLAVGGYVFEERKGGESYNSFPGIAAHVTAYARLKLQELRSQVDPGHVYYMDTDSLIVDEYGKSQLEYLIHSSRMGALKVEHQSPWLEINAPKDYKMENRTRIKGVRMGAAELSDGVYQQDQWERLAGKIQRGHINGYSVSQIIKHQRREIFSGVVLPSGWVSPFVLDQGQVVQAAPLGIELSELLSRGG